MENNEENVVKRKYEYKGKNYLSTDFVDEEIKELERVIGKIPEELKTFWVNEGYGFISKNETGWPLQRLLSPKEVIDFINREDIYKNVVDSDYFRTIEDKGFVFMEYDEETYFWIGNQEDNLGKIYDFDEVICESFNEFIKRLENGEFI